MSKLEKHKFREATKFGGEIEWVAYYRAEPVDRLLTEALGLASKVIKLRSLISYSPETFADYQAAQRFREEHGHD